MILVLCVTNKQKTQISSEFYYITAILRQLHRFFIWGKNEGKKGYGCYHKLLTASYATISFIKKSLKRLLFFDNSASKINDIKYLDLLLYKYNVGYFSDFRYRVKSDRDKVQPEKIQKIYYALHTLRHRLTKFFLVTTISLHFN